MSRCVAPRFSLPRVALAAFVFVGATAAPALGVLGAPTLNAPAFTNATPYVATWTAVTGATTYDYEFNPGVCGAADPIPGGLTTGTLTHSEPFGAEGAYCFKVRAANAVPDTGPWIAKTTTYDHTAPPVPSATSVGLAPPLFAPTYNLSDTEPGVTFEWDFGGQTANGASAAQSTNALVGIYTFSARAKDTAGNVSPPTTISFELVAPPAPGITSGPADNAVLGQRPTFTLNANGAPGAAQRTWNFTGVPSGGGDTAALALSGADGAYTFTATQSINTRTSGTVVRHFTLDTTVPAVPTIGGGVADGTFTKVVPTFTLSGAGAGPGSQETYDWILEGPTPVAGVTQTVDLGTLADGAYTLKARLVDVAGNKSAFAVRLFTLDRQKPTIPTLTPDLATIVNKPPTGTIGGGGEPIVSSRWQLDDAPILVGPSFSTVGLGDGSHTLRAWITDRAGNESDPLVRIFKLDRLAPNPPDIGPIPGSTNRVPTVTITSIAGQKIQWTLTGPKAVQGDGVSPLQPSLGTLPDGDYTLSATTTSPAGNLSGASSTSFRLDRVVPSAPKILTKPSSEGGDTEAVFSWQGEPGGSYSWIVGFGDLTIKGPVTTRETSVKLPKLEGGLYTFKVAQTDAAGNQGPNSDLANFAVFKTANSSIPRIKSTGKPSVAATKTATKVTAKKPKIPTFGPLYPKAGKPVRLGTGTLQWRYRSGRLAELFNVQIFDEGGAKVYSVFPTGQSIKVPRSVLKVDKKYYWQVWPYWGKARGYAPKPLGVSSFNVARPAASKRLPAERPQHKRNG